MSKTELQDLGVKLSKLEEEIKKVTRRLDETQKSVDLLFKDREILEDIQGSISHLKEIIVQNQQHQDVKHEDIKSDIQEVAHTTQDMAENSVVVRTTNKSLLTKLIKIFKREVKE